MLVGLSSMALCFAWFYTRSVEKTLTDDELEQLIDEKNLAERNKQFTEARNKYLVNQDLIDEYYANYDDRWCGYCRTYGLCDGDHSFR